MKEYYIPYFSINSDCISILNINFKIRNLQMSPNSFQIQNISYIKMVQYCHIIN